MELHQIRYFLALSDTANFTRASERCFVSQPAMTKAIQRLEDALGGRLFDRTRTAVQLTELGRAMHPYLKQIFDTAAATRDQARRFLRQQRTVLALGVMCTIDFKQLLPALREFDAQHPDIELQFVDGGLDALLEALDRHELDAAIVASPNDYPRRFHAAPLYRERFVVAHAQGHRYGRGGPIRLADLAEEPYCSRTHCEFADYIDRLMREQAIDVEVVQAADREDWVAAMVGAGMGVAWMPELSARDARLSYTTVADCEVARTVCLLTAVEHSGSDAVSRLRPALARFAWPALPA